jgi:hypothetical protein
MADDPAEFNRRYAIVRGRETRGAKHPPGWKIGDPWPPPFRAPDTGVNSNSEELAPVLQDD